jgi:hypothetical protein
MFLNGKMQTLFIDKHSGIYFWEHFVSNGWHRHKMVDWGIGAGELTLIEGGELEMR